MKKPKLQGAASDLLYDLRAHCRLNSIYDFYRLPRRDRNHLIDQVVMETGSKTLYFPVGLAKGEFNYDKPEGLVFVTEVSTLKAKKPVVSGKGGTPERKWFRVGVCSPDDLDRDLDFDGLPGLEALREKAIAHLKAMNKRDVTYEGLLDAIKAHVGAGERTS